MRRPRGQVIAVLVALATAGFAASSCQQLVGIEDRPFQSGSQASALCREYCEVALRACVGQFAVYSSTATCEATCALLPEGDVLEPTGNTVACRKREAELAEATGEAAVHCPRSGPGGAGTCGDDCESYCALLEQACPSAFALTSDCVQQCRGLKDTGAFDVIVDHDGDTLQCRLVHVSSAAVNPAEHCPHAQLLPTAPCDDPSTSLPDCESFCQLNLTACSGEHTVYESREQCLDVCAALPQGETGHRTENTVGCRRYHSYSSLVAPATHCSHTGPGGDGHCGLDADDTLANCESYCHLLDQACGEEFAKEFSDLSDCVSDCSSQPKSFGAAADSGYDVASAQTGGTLACRLLHVSRALSDATECASAMGGGDCQ